MISVQEATNIVLAHPCTFESVEADLSSATGLILAEDLVADRDFPPFERVTMDGIAIRYQRWVEGQRSFKVQETVGAGAPQSTLKDTAMCIEIMTGAVLPTGADTVIRYEDVEIIDGTAHLTADVKDGQNVHHQGEDRKQGSVIVPAGTPVNPAAIGVAATVGRTRLRVLEPPRICVISTGDELVAIEDTPLAHQIRRSNVHAIAALLRATGVETSIRHIADDPQTIAETLAGLLESNHALVLSGGVSKGKFDYVPAALENIGVNKHFHRVAQRPGKPFWFGTWEDDTAVFALPGNPVSSFMSTLRYVQPWLRKSQAQPATREYARLADSFSFNRDLTYFLQVALDSASDGTTLATPVPGRGSGDHANLVEAQGFLELPPEQEQFSMGDAYPLWRYA